MSTTSNISTEKYWLFSGPSTFDIFDRSTLLSVLLHLGFLALTLVTFISNDKELEMTPPPLQISMVSIAAPNITEASKKPSEDAKYVKKVVVMKKPSDLPPLKKVVTSDEPFFYPQPEKQEKTEEAEIVKKEIEEAKDKKEQIKKAEKNLPKPHSMMRKQLTANGDGNSASNIVPLLSEADYVQTVPPIYPSRAIEMGQQGTVIIKALITSNGGHAKKISIHSSSGFKLLDNSALNAVKEWSFKTASTGSKEMASWVMVPVRFIIR